MSSSKNSNCSVRVRKCTSKGRVGYEGIVNIPGLSSSKVTTTDGRTFFQTPSALSSAIRSLRQRTSIPFEMTENWDTTTTSKSKKTSLITKSKKSIS